IIESKLRNSLEETPSISRKSDVKIAMRDRKYSPTSLLFESKNKVEPSYLDNKKIKKNELIKLIEKESCSNNGERVDLGQLLIKNGYSTTIEKINFIDTNLLKNININDITFHQCKFSWSHFTQSNLSNVRFSYCKLLNASFENSSIKNCHFNKCKMRELMFTASRITNCHFRSSDIISTSFEDSQVKGCHFKNITAPGSHFLDAEINDSHIIESNLRDCYFFNNLDKFVVTEKVKNTATISKPLAIIPVYAEVRGVTTPKAYMKMAREANIIPLRISVQPQKIIPENVNSEVSKLLVKIRSENNSGTPIPKQLLELAKENPDTYPEINKILGKSTNISKHINAFYLPGGEDIPASLYGKEDHEKNSWGGDYRRSILELSIIDQAINKGIPLMAICRGYQMTNVYFGAQIKQHIKGHKGIQRFRPNSKEKAGLYGKVLQNPLISAVAHHQAVPENNGANEYLDPIITYEGTVKASEIKYPGSAPAILLQFHPEFNKVKTADSMTQAVTDIALTSVMSSSNDQFWTILSDSAQTHQNYKRVKQELLSQP
ncbi:gamma-glutamyl-gamma-aminobutyrate hydrolase family protein, partial [Vibrio aquimaris]